MVGPEWRHARLLPHFAMACFGGAVLWEIRTTEPRRPGAELSTWLSPGASPLVIADGQTFLQLNHYLDAESAGRLVFLTDRASALHYMGTDCYDGAIPAVRPWFPVRGRVVPYTEFIAHREPFLI